MSCHFPLSAWLSEEVNKNGKRPLVFKKEDALFPDKEIRIGCGQCAGCRLERSRQWAMRIMFEAQQWEQNSFITLTFDDAHLNQRKNPDSVDKSEFQRFMKRLRRRNENKKIRFYHCGEYGELNRRPHYHACLFNHDFDDKQLWSTKEGNNLYISGELESLWPYGFSTVGEVTFESAAYVARYIMKKINGKLAEDHYQVVKGINLETGEVDYKPIEPEYTTMSRRPGIGRKWYEKYKNSDLYNKDYVMVRGKRMNAPKAFDRWLEQDDPELYDIIKENRTEALETLAWETPSRLEIRRESLEVKLNRKRRTL